MMIVSGGVAFAMTPSTSLLMSAVPRSRSGMGSAMSDTTRERQTGAGIHYGAAPEVKRRHRAMWALGDYPTVAADLVTPLGHVLVDACRVGPGDRLLDVAAGTGTVAIPAARAGARVTASDLTPELLAAGKRLAGLTVFRP